MLNKFISSPKKNHSESRLENSFQSIEEKRYLTSPKKIWKSNVDMLPKTASMKYCFCMSPNIKRKLKWKKLFTPGGKILHMPRFIKI